MQVLAINSQSGKSKEGKEYTRHTVYLRDGNAIHELPFFEAEAIAGIKEGDNVEVKYELRKDYKSGYMVGRPVGVSKVAK